LVLRCGNRQTRRLRGQLLTAPLIDVMGKIRVFVSEHCGPCQIIKDMIDRGQVSDKDLELIDIESDEGFPYIGEFALTGVPSAYKENQKCEIKIDQSTDKLHIICPETSTEALPSSDEDQVSPP